MRAVTARRVADGGARGVGAQGQRMCVRAGDLDPDCGNHLEPGRAGRGVLTLTAK